jgi:Dolichyl-phosphate-mannose-protein mannosyltransferase
MSFRTALIFIWLAFVARGVFYATFFPMWEGLDEYQHYAYVSHLVVHKTLPRPDDHVSADLLQSLEIGPVPWAVLNPLQRPLMTHDQYWMLSPAERTERQARQRALSAELQAADSDVFLYEEKQPPLYYLLCAPLLKFFSGQTLATRLFVLRVFTVLLVSIVVPFTFLVARRAFGKAEPALLAATVMTAMPQLLMTAGQMTNTAFVIALFALLTWALLRPDPWDRRGVLLIGITLGAGFLTKGLFVASLPAVAWSGIRSIWKAPPERRTRVAASVAAAAVLVIGMPGWWYIRTLGTEGPVWADASPSARGSSLVSYAARAPWWEAVHWALNTHIWMGGWSFLGLRSWIYAVFRPIFLILFLGSFIAMLRRSLPALIWWIYGGCWAAMLYHAFVTFVRLGTISSTGVYLFAVAACEGVILCSAARFWLPSPWSGRAIAILTGMFLLMEAYATHFVFLPYYAGIIRHRPDGSLQAFHVTQALDLGWTEILRRLSINKPDFMAPGVIAVLWGLFLIANVFLLIQTWRIASRKV